MNLFTMDGTYDKLYEQTYILDSDNHDECKHFPFHDNV